MSIWSDYQRSVMEACTKTNKNPITHWSASVCHDLGPLHMSPVTGLALLTCRILLCVHMGHFSLVDQVKFKKPNQMVKHKLVSFATVVALWTVITLLIKLICMLLKWKYIHGKNYAILIAMTRKRSYFVKKVLSRHVTLLCLPSCFFSQLLIFFSLIFSVLSMSSLSY